jgi:CBS domain-containing protein
MHRLAASAFGGIPRDKNKKMKIKDIMVTKVTSATPDTGISEVVDIIFRHRFHGLPVISGERVVGIITEDDFFLKNYDDLYLPSYIQFLQKNKIADNLSEETREKIKKLLGTKARDLMTANPVCVEPETEISDLMELIKKTKFTTFPVTDKNKNLVGLVTLADILGTVREGSREMKKAFKGEKEIEELARELDNEWKDKLVIMSRKKVRTWAGMVLILAIAGLGAAILLITNTSSRPGYEMGNRGVYPLECQKFIYSDWSACRADGTQTRQVIERLPRNCKGGGTPELVRICN